MISRNGGFVNLAACTAICVTLWIVSSVPFVAAQSSWQAEWEKTLRAAEAEGQFALYGCCYDYNRVLEVFRKRYRLEEGKKYFDLARPEYQDLTPIFKLVKEVLSQK
jgi:hypothetical protein